MIREKMPWPLQRHIWASNCQDQQYNIDDGGFVFTLEHCAKPDLDQAVAEALERFRADQELQDKLRGRMSQLTVVIGSFYRNIQNIEAIIVDLDDSELPAGAQ
jgi:hypothetical protein